MDRVGLHKLLNLEVDQRSPGFILYSEKISPRLNYTAQFIFEHVLKTKLIIANTISEFESSGYFKINYSSKIIPGAFQIVPHPFLFESGVSENKPPATLKNDLVYFFVNDTGNFNYDIFSSVFYFISRYEEWQSFTPDAHGRFEANNSILFKQKLHLKPIVDIWILELKNELNNFFNGINFPTNKFKIISTIDVDNLYAYKEKGFLRTAGAICKDILKFDLANLKERKNVLSGKAADPFDIYTSVSDYCSNNKMPLIYFFLFRSGTKYDRTIDPTSNAFVEVFKRIKERAAFIGLHPSYHSSETKTILQHEIKDISNKLGKQVQLSRQHYLKFNIKTTPAWLLQNNILADFTMGFASEVGFRAGTSFPFYYYDLANETQTDLLFVPFCAMDGAYFVYDKIHPDQMLSSLLNLAKEVKNVNGLFISVFHERTFSNHLYPGYDRIYKNLHQKINEL
ncbi:MAG: hypothetical protein H0U95_12695 [Bacteroidetes bacterium]|nr:hypothetical protein [Bacteroidota bacterium]